MTQLQNSVSILDIVKYANDSTDGLLCSLLILSIFIVLLFGLKRYEFEKGFLVSCFICFILSLFLTYAGLLPFIFDLAFLIGIALTGLYMFMTGN